MKGAYMANYTEQENKELNQQLARWQKRQLTAVRQKNIDIAFEKMAEWESSVWEKIAKATTHNDVSPYVWDLAERVIDKYCKMAR